MRVDQEILNENFVAKGGGRHLTESEGYKENKH